MKRKKIITICSSASFYKQVLEIQVSLRKLGFMVKIPSSANLMKRNNNFDVSFYKTWHTDKSTYKKKTALMNSHFKKVLEGDCILVVNYDKNGITGYIGGNGLLEMLVAYLHKKPIYVLNPIGTYMLTEEVYGLEPIFLNGDLAKIPR